MNKTDFILDIRKTQAPLKAMVEMIPDDKLDWAPAKGFMSVGQVLKHLSENWCVIRMMITNEWPFSDAKEMEECMKLENMPACSKSEALEAMDKDLNDAVAYMEKEISDKDFFDRQVTAPWGFSGAIWQAVMMIKDHQLNHKMQLHLYLKLLGKPVHTGTLYGM
ncbi:MAG: DinB family protein [Planctomycetota bacterium]